MAISGIDKGSVCTGMHDIGVPTPTSGAMQAPCQKVVI